MSETTTIQIPIKLKKELTSLKDYNRETYADVIEKLISIAKQDEEDKFELSEETLKNIAEARDDIKKGRVYSSKQIKKDLGL
ncbi:MAG: hypothetical protein V1672_01800 [Candidatus Diapherotrites archaeon]